MLLAGIEVEEESVPLLARLLHDHLYTTPATSSGMRSRGWRRSG
jgi:hypothetical protein